MSPIKNIVKFITVCIAVLAFAPATLEAKDSYTKNISKLPSVAVEFIKANFSDLELSGIKIDKGFFANSYDVYFTNGTKIEFDSKGEWTEVENKLVGIKGPVIPEKIQKVLDEDFKGAKVINIERKRRGYEVDLSNDLELIFDLQGNFIGID